MARRPEGQDYTVTIRVDPAPPRVYDAVNDVRGWWSGEIDGTTDQLGAVWTYRYRDLHRSTQQITEMVPGRRVVWHVVDSRLSFVKDPTEWNGTDLVFDIARKGDRTELRFTHVGLRPAVECYANCTDAWGYYIRDSLRKLITTGKGTPNPKE
ncbi:MAG TPA: SRPBCC domain-containing protein [Thermoplasmata archaeon]|nr:SRPBCC domain-containing protein [Thermoplasmata archaeon]